MSKPYVKPADIARGEIEEVCGMIAHLNLGRLAKNETAQRALVVARWALGVAADARPDATEKEAVADLHAIVLSSCERGRRLKAAYSIPELGRMMHPPKGRHSMKRWLDRWNVPYAAPPGGRNYEVLLKDLLRCEGWAGVEMKRGYLKGGAREHRAVALLDGGTRVRRAASSDKQFAQS